MAKKKQAAKRADAESTESDSAESRQTIVWGRDVEEEDYVKLPRFVTRIGRYWPANAPSIEPRHLILLLALAGRKFQNHEIRAYWAELADDVGKSPETVRKWAYELRKKRLVEIIRGSKRKESDRRTGWRNDRNTFDLSPFMRIARKAWRVRVEDRKRAKQLKTVREAVDG